jgi:hypothetical protein
MSLRIWRRVRIAPFARVSLSKRGLSLSVGRKGAWFTQGMRGQRFTVGAPGTGLFWTEQVRSGAARQGRSTPVIIAWLVALIVLAIAISFFK